MDIHRAGARVRTLRGHLPDPAQQSSSTNSRIVRHACDAEPSVGRSIIVSADEAAALIPDDACITVCPPLPSPCLLSPTSANHTALHIRRPSARRLTWLQTSLGARSTALPCPHTCTNVARPAKRHETLHRIAQLLWPAACFAGLSRSLLACKRSCYTFAMHFLCPGSWGHGLPRTGNAL